MACGSVVRGKNLFCFHLIENFVPLNCVRKYFHSEKKRKTSFSFAFRSLIRNCGLKPDILYNYVKNGKVVNCWKGHEAPLPEGWITEQEPNRCRLVHRTDVGRGMGDTDIYLEYSSDKPAKPGLLIGQRLFLEAGTYYLTAIFFAQGENEMPTNVSLAAKGYESSCRASSLMDWNYFPITLREAQEITVGLWAPEGCDVRRAGISALVVWAAKP